ncbi:MAG: hypothetical protein OXS29_09900 [bacterium]|nr:hypothetical protein [bacterium]MDE0289641.1 hypothetical protein [bacterium]
MRRGVIVVARGVLRVAGDQWREAGSGGRAGRGGWGVFLGWPWDGLRWAGWVRRYTRGVFTGVYGMAV